MNKIIFTLLSFILFFACTSSAIHRKAKELNYKAVNLIKEGNLDMAERHLELALEYNKDYPEAYNNLGVIYMRQNKIDKAEKYFSLAINYNSDFAEAHNNLGYIYLINGDIKKAEQRLKCALNIDPSFENARFNLARTYYLAKDYDNAESELKKLMIISENVEFYLLLIDVYIKKNKIADAFSLIDEIMKKERFLSKALYIRGYLNIILNRCEDAISDFEKIKQEYKNSMDFLINLSAGYICTKDYSKAEPILKGLLQIQKDEPLVLYNLGRIEYERKNYEMAQIYFKKSFEQGFVPACSYLVDALFAGGKNDESIKVASKCK